MANFRLLDPGRKFTDSNGNPASGYQLFVYDAGTTTKATSFKDSAGAANHTNPIVLESDGGLPNRELWVAAGSYKLVLASDTDTDPPTSGTTLGDNLDPINDVASNSASEWTPSGLTPTYVDGDTFTVPGDQTTILHPGRRLQITDGGGTVYATIASSSFSDPNTAVNLTVDGSDTIDSSISAASYGLISANNSSIAQACELLIAGTASAANEIEVANMSGDYSMYLLVLEDITPGTDAVTPSIQTSTDNGSTYTSAASSYNYSTARGATGSIAEVYATGNTRIAMSDQGLGTAAGETTSAKIWVMNPTNASGRTVFMWDFHMVNNNGFNLHHSGSGRRLADEANDAFRFYMSSGTISANYQIYGFRTR